MREKMELLAPAGDLEKLKIAVDYGADAVYFGGEMFSLRAGAGNLTIGTESGLRYVAQVMIPAATYTETPIQTEEGVEPLAEGSGDGMNSTVQREQNPLDMGDVTLVLWSIE